MTETAMLAALYRRNGPAAEVLRVERLPRPEPGPGEVLVRISVSAVNPTDWKARLGVTGRPLERPFQVPHQDGAGVIEAVGEGVDAGRVGERVWLYFAARGQWGTAAEWTVVPSGQAVSLPDDVPSELGAQLGVPALTAHRCLFADGPVEGCTVLVAGGAGAVGHAAIELARWAGARVVATVSSPEKAELATAAGADAVVDYTAPDAGERLRAAAPDGFDRIAEVALADNLELDVPLCATGAAIASYAADWDDVAALPVRRLMTRNVTLRFVLLYSIPRDALEAAVAATSDALAAGALSSLPLTGFPLERIADAHEAVEAGAIGRTLVYPPSSASLTS